MSKLIITLITFSIFFTSIHGYTQYIDEKGDTIFNQTDENGMKFGYWKKYYPDSSLLYEGFFVNNKPRGTFKRYYDNRSVKAIMHFADDGVYSKAKLFYNNSKPAAEGWYYGNQKDSTWKYYSYYDGSLMLKEHFDEGIRNGISEKYYPNGQILEEIEWEKDIKNGTWKQYFKNGRIKLKGTYKNNKRNGDFHLYFNNGQIEMQGRYVDDYKHDTWKYFDKEGTKILEVEYKYGIPQNEEVLSEKEQEFFKQMEENLGKVKEPDVEDFVPYLR